MTPNLKLSLALGLSQRVGVVSGVASLHVLVLAGSLLIGSEMVAPPTVLGVDVVAQGELAFEAGEAPAPDSPVVSPPVAEPAAEAAQAQRQEVARNEPQKAPPAPATRRIPARTRRWPRTNRSRDRRKRRRHRSRRRPPPAASARKTAGRPSRRRAEGAIPRWFRPRSTATSSIPRRRAEKAAAWSESPSRSARMARFCASKPPARPAMTFSTRPRGKWWPPLIFPRRRAGDFSARSKSTSACAREADACAFRAFSDHIDAICRGDFAPWQGGWRRPCRDTAEPADAATARKPPARRVRFGGRPVRRAPRPHPPCALRRAPAGSSPRKRTRFRRYGRKTLYRPNFSRQLGRAPVKGRGSAS